MEEAQIRLLSDNIKGKPKTTMAASNSWRTRTETSVSISLPTIWAA